MSTNLVKMIKRELETNENHQHQIAAKLGVNQGRISEVKHGQYDHLFDIENRQGSLF